MAADDMIGKLLASFPRNKEKLYPPKVICEVMEMRGAEYILNAFSTQIFNSRGATIRGPFSGGALERVLVEEFGLYAKKLQLRYPSVAKVFRDLARRYELHAVKEDNESIVNRLDN